MLSTLRPANAGSHGSINTYASLTFSTEITGDAADIMAELKSALAGIIQVCSAGCLTPELISEPRHASALCEAQHPFRKFYPCIMTPAARGAGLGLYKPWCQGRLHLSRHRIRVTLCSKFFPACCAMQKALRAWAQASGRRGPGSKSRIEQNPNPISTKTHTCIFLLYAHLWIPDKDKTLEIQFISGGHARAHLG